MLGLIGKTVSHYHILEQIGQGGMSSVFHAVDLRDERAVALKVLSPYIANEPRFRARFAREIKLLHRMEHPNIMPILDFGEVDGLAYIVMPYISSGTLQDRLARGPVEPSEANRIVGQLASALQCAHDRGVIHRDVKPSNILLDPQGNVLLSDFSFAHQADASQNLTGSALVGTPAYMAPEQCRGEPIDARSDQYAMAVVLYQMATGQLPFEADTPMGVALKHINEPLPRPTQLNPNLPPEIEMVLVKGLAKDPNLRFGSVTALGEAFRQAIAIGLDPSLRTGTVNLHRTSEIYKKYQNVQPPARRRWFERSAVVAALFVLIACPASAAGLAFFFPGLIGGDAYAASLADIQATVDVILTANPPGEGTRLPPGAMETQVFLAVIQTLEATVASFGDPTLEAVAEAVATEGTPTPFEFAIIFPTPIPTSTKTGSSGGDEPPEPTATLSPSDAPTNVPPTAPGPSDTAAPTATGGVPASDTEVPTGTAAATVAATAATTPTPSKTHPGPPPTSTSAPPTSTSVPPTNPPPPPPSNTPPPPAPTNTPQPPAATNTPRPPNTPRPTHTDKPTKTPKGSNPTDPPPPPTDPPPPPTEEG